MAHSMTLSQLRSVARELAAPTARKRALAAKVAKFVAHLNFNTMPAADRKKWNGVYIACQQVLDDQPLSASELAGSISRAI